MNFSIINKILLSLFFLIVFNSCSTQTVYDKIKIKKYDVPIIDDYDDNYISFKSSNYKEINYENYLILKDFKNNNKYLNNVQVYNDQIFVFNNNKLINFDYVTGEIISQIELKNLNIIDDILVSFNYFENSFILAFKSGSIFRININGDIIWKYETNKTINTPIRILNEQIIILLGDEIKSLLFKNGTVIWSETYDDLPVYQAKGGQLSNFLNLLFFILPNNRVGALDYSLGSIHSSNFDEITLISSINNTKDKIYINENFLIYLDEGKYLYTFDIFKNDFVLNKKIINSAESNILFNNSIILKEGKYLQAININNGKTFWLIFNDDLSKNSKIIGIRNYNNNIEIFLNNGDVLTINDKKLIKIINLNVGKIKKISFERDKIIVQTESSKTVIF